MKLAINEAWKYQFLTYPNPAVGACVVQDNQLLSVEAHKEAGDPHAEVLALKEAYLTKYPASSIKNISNSQDIHNFLIQNHNNFFINCTIYVTLEPCNHIGRTPACAMLLESIGIKKVIIGMLDPNKKASGGKQRLEKAGIEVEVLDDIRCQNLLFPFNKWQNDSFIFYKLAMREDGSIDGGYITSNDSLKLVHNIRTKLDMMVISGKTIRDDRPTLDARFATSNKAPNILIYSKQQNFDTTIPLFKVENRTVVVDDKLDILDNYNFIMIEGGYSLLKSIKGQIDMLMLFVSHKIPKQNQFDIESLGFKKIYSYFINTTDEVMFLI